MSIFEEIRLSWGGKDYVIPPDQVMRVIAKVEDVITLSELHTSMAGRKPPIGKLAQAFGITLRHAGASVTDEQVYAGMFEGAAMRERLTAAVTVLLALMIPPQSIKAAGEGKDPGKDQAAVPASSKRRSR